VAEATRRWAPSAVAFAALSLGLLAVEKAAILGIALRQGQVHQALVNTGNMEQVGRWLRIHAQPGETVYLEPFGYIGYFSRAHIVDYPGLVAPQVVRLRKEQGLDFQTAFEQLQPDWLVLRPGEVHRLAQSNFFRGHYTLAAEFDVRAKVEAQEFLPVKLHSLYDSYFLIFKAKQQARSDKPAG